MPTLVLAALSGISAPPGLASVPVAAVVVALLLWGAHLLGRGAPRVSVCTAGVVLLLLGWSEGILFEQPSFLRLVTGATMFAGTALAIAGAVLLLLPGRRNAARQAETDRGEVGPGPRNGEPDSVAELRARLQKLERGLRWAMVALLVVATSRAMILLSGGTAQGEMYNALLAGIRLPYVTALTIAFHAQLGFACGLLGATALLLLLLQPERGWVVPLSVASAAILLIISEIAAYAWQSPLLRIVECLGA